MSIGADWRPQPMLTYAISANLHTLHPSLISARHTAVRPSFHITCWLPGLALNLAIPYFQTQRLLFCPFSSFAQR